MSETPLLDNEPSAADEMDLESWLAGGARNTRLVPVYARLDLQADIQKIEAQIPEKKREVLEQDAAFDGSDYDDEFSDLRAQAALLWKQLDASRKEFRVAGRTEEEVEAIKKQVTEDLQTEIDEAAAYGRKEGHKNAKRAGLTAVNDINAMVRQGAIEEMGKVIDREVSIRTIAASSTIRVGAQWLTLTRDDVYKMYNVLGEAQIGRLAQAAARSQYETANVSIPK